MRIVNKTWILVAAPLIAGLMLGLGIAALRQTPNWSDVVLPTLAVLPSPTSGSIAIQPTIDTGAQRSSPTALATEPVISQAVPDAPFIANPPAAVTQNALPALAEPTIAPVQVTLPEETVPNQLVIRFAPQASAQERQDYVEQLGGQVVQQIDALDTVVVEVPPQITLPESPLVTNTEPDYYVSAQHEGIETTEPNDPLFPQQWALPVIGAAEAWHHLGPDAPRTTVAVIDSGICDHPELNGHVVAGWDFVQNDASPQDEFGHGCAVAGIIGANVNDGVGMTGIAPNVDIMPLRVLDARGLGAYSDVAAAIIYAVDHGARIINLSLGGAQPSSTLEDAVNYAIAHDVIVVAAAGNTGSSQLLYPAAYEPVIAVGSVDSNLQHSSFSNHGPAVDLWAPGRDILTTSTTQGYTRMTGTSFAAPHVSGIAVLEMVRGRALVLNRGIVTLEGLPVVIALTPTPPTPIIEVTPTPQETAYSAPALFIDTQSQGALNMATNLGVTRTRYVEINFDAISNTGASASGIQSARTDAMLLNLFPDVSLVADSLRVDEHSTISDGFVWVGKVEGVENSEVILVVTDGEIAGHVLSDGNLYEIAVAGNGLHAVNQIDINVLGRLHINPLEVPEQRDTKTASASTVAQTTGQPIIDVMVVYTPRARAQQGGTYPMVDAIQASVTSTNQAYINSEIDQRINLVYAGEIDYVEVGGNGEDLFRLGGFDDGYMDDVHTLRITHGADLVVLIAEIGNYCGIAWQMGPPPDTSFEQWAFSIVRRSCLPGGLTFAHETGHNMGNAHDIANAVDGAFSYSYGYHDPGGAFLDIMAYPVTNCSPCPQVNYYSNTTRTLNGRAMGIVNQIDLARSMNNTADVVSIFRPILNGPPPTNDTFSGARNITSLPVEFTETNIYNSVVSRTDPYDPTDPAKTCASRLSNTVWYKYTPAYEQTVQISTAGSNYDTIIGVYSGSEGSLSLIGCNDDISQDTTSFLEVEMEADKTYRIMIAHWGGAPLPEPGTLELTVQPICDINVAMPHMLAPSPASSSSSQRPTFSWAPLCGAASYELQLSRSNLPTETITISGTSYTPPAPLLVDTYYWRVRGLGLDFAVSPWSDVRSVVITTQNALPARNFYDDTRTPTLRWSGISWAKGYRIQVDNNSDFSSREYEFDTNDNTVLSLTTSSLPNGVYYWRVCAKRDAVSCGAWSASDTFMIDVP